VIAASSSGTSFFLIIIIGFVLLWLIVVRPQRRRQSQQQQMLRDLQVGDEVITAGGIYGEIVRLEEDEVAVEIAPQLEVRVARRAIAAVLSEPEEAEEPDEAEEPGPEDEADDAEGAVSDEEHPG
jgi:preprotein translocase subunit YajC